MQQLFPVLILIVFISIMKTGLDGLWHLLRRNISVQSRFRSQQVFLKKCYSKRVKPVKEVLEFALKDYKDLEFIPVRIDECSFGRGFSEAYIKYQDYYIPNDDVTVSVDFQTLFKRGFECLEAFVSEEMGYFDVAKGIDFFHPFSAFRDFLNEIEYHESCLKCPTTKFDASEEIKEGEIAAVLTNHLLSCLVFGNRYLLRNNYEYKATFCPCLKSSSCRKLNYYGHTGLGNDKIWYGYADITLLPKKPPYLHLPIWIYEENLDKKDEEQKNECGCEAELCLQSSFDNYAEQAFSQAITFSFYQANLKEKHGLQQNTTLIPSLVLTPSHYYIVMYDFEHDVLLSSGHNPAALWDNNNHHFNMSAIIQIWMILNHIDFSPCFDSNMVKLFDKCCNFHNLLRKYELFDECKNIDHKDSFKPEKEKHCHHVHINDYLEQQRSY